MELAQSEPKPSLQTQSKSLLGLHVIMVVLSFASSYSKTVTVKEKQSQKLAPLEM